MVFLLFLLSLLYIATTNTGMTEMRDPLITIAIVNYNAGAMLAECLKALQLQDMAEFKVVVVDNASRDDSLENLPNDPRIEIIRSDTNLGFAAANNLALLEADTPWVATLNPDTKPAVNWLSSLLYAAGQHPEVVMFGSSQLSAADPQFADGFGDEYFMSGICWRKCNGAPTPTPLPGGEVFAPCAAAAMYRTDIYKQMGGFCERFFCYVEDIDLAFRVRLAGGTCLQVPAAVVFHHGYAITGNRSDFTMYHCTRNMIWAYLRCMPLPLLLLTLPLHVGMIAFIYAWSIKKGNAEPVGRGIRDGVKGIGSSLRERKAIQQMRRTSIKQISRAMIWNPMQIIRWRKRVAARNKRG